MKQASPLSKRYIHIRYIFQVTFCIEDDVTCYVYNKGPLNSSNDNSHAKEET